MHVNSTKSRCTKGSAWPFTTVQSNICARNAGDTHDNCLHAVVATTAAAAAAAEQ